MEESKRTGCMYLYSKSYRPELPLAVGMRDFEKAMRILVPNLNDWT
jgi:hypothetical protein